MANETYTPTPSTPATPPVTFPDSEFSRAYAKRLPEIQAVQDDQLLTFNFDVQPLITTALGALPQIRALDKELHALGGINEALVDGLEEYAEAAAEAQARYLAATAPPSDIIALNETALHLREILRSDATALATRGLLDRAHFNKFDGSNGYRNVGFELSGWASVMQAEWSRIAGKTALTFEEIVNAKKVGEQLVRAAGIKDMSPATVAEFAKIRQQAVSLLFKAYEEVQRGVEFVRFHEGDAETVAPSLYALQRTRKSSGSKQSEDKPAPKEEPVATAPAASPTPATSGSVASPAPAQAAVPQGMPGARPFAN